ncbi:MAG: cysteine desulfurase [Myxococcales bacterium]|nr:MAG: cysteine desulfurase [Myxococcales bacterium]
MPEPLVYFDHHATTPCDPRVVEAMAPYWTRSFGNAASATHRYGWEAEAAVEDARERIARAIGAADASEIVFTSGTTESDNLAIQGVARASGTRDGVLATTAIEHPAVLDTCRALAGEGFELGVLPVDPEGLVDPTAIEAMLGPRTLLVSVGAANSEIGVLQPLEEIGEICRRRGVAFHSDAAQAVGKIPIDVARLGVDLLSFCAHKLYGPKGIGALYLRRKRPRLRLAPLLHGGGHERGRRSGTLPVALIVGFARAMELCLEDLDAEAKRLGALRDHLWERLSQGLPGVRRNGHASRRLSGNLHVAFEGVEIDAVIASLREFALSAGSACASGSGEPSHVLRAIGLPDALARGALRVGLGRANTLEQVDRLADRLIEEVARLRERRGA